MTYEEDQEILVKYPLTMAQEDGEQWFPTCFRDSSELQDRS